MEFKIKENKLIAYENDLEEGYILFKRLNNETIVLMKTFVHEIARGKGLAKLLNIEFFNSLDKDIKKIIIQCSYSLKFFNERKEEYKNLLLIENDEFPTSCVLG